MNDYQFVAPRPWLETMLRRLLRAPDTEITSALHPARLAGRVQLIAGAAPNDRPGQLRLALRITETAPTEAQWRQWLNAPADASGAGLALGRDGRLAARVASDGHLVSPLELQLLGSGMHRIRLQNPTAPVPLAGGTDRWSRLIGALGRPTWERLRGLHVAIAGAGRNGSLAAHSLARAGIGRLTLIDPDRLELHNLDAMDVVGAADLGRSKAECLAQRLREVADPGTEVTALPLSVTAPWGISGLREADLIVCCVDHDASRLAVAILATLYSRPLLDIGSGVFDLGDHRRMGGEVRLVLPGEGRCLCCYGGFSRPGQLRDLVRTQPTSSLGDWQTERAGSLRSLNAIVVHLGLRLIEDLVGERVRHSTWLRLEYTADGVPKLEQIESPRQNGCILCRRAGRADSELARLSDLASLLSTTGRL